MVDLSLLNKKFFVETKSVLENRGMFTNYRSAHNTWRKYTSSRFIVRSFSERIRFTGEETRIILVTSDCLLGSLPASIPSSDTTLLQFHEKITHLNIDARLGYLIKRGTKLFGVKHIGIFNISNIDGYFVKDIPAINATHVVLSGSMVDNNIKNCQFILLPESVTHFSVSCSFVPVCPPKAKVAIFRRRYHNISAFVRNPRYTDDVYPGHALGTEWYSGKSVMWQYPPTVTEMCIDIDFSSAASREQLPAINYMNSLSCYTEIGEGWMGKDVSAGGLELYRNPTQNPRYFSAGDMTFYKCDRQGRAVCSSICSGTNLSSLGFDTAWIKCLKTTINRPIPPSVRWLCLNGLGEESNKTNTQNSVRNMLFLHSYTNIVEFSITGRWDSLTTATEVLKRLPSSIRAATITPTTSEPLNPQNHMVKVSAKTNPQFLKLVYLYQHPAHGFEFNQMECLKYLRLTVLDFKTFRVSRVPTSVETLVADRVIHTLQTTSPRDSIPANVKTVQLTKIDYMYKSLFTNQITRMCISFSNQLLNFVKFSVNITHLRIDFSTPLTRSDRGSGVEDNNLDLYDLIKLKQVILLGGFSGAVLLPDCVPYVMIGMGFKPVVFMLPSALALIDYVSNDNGGKSFLDDSPLLLGVTCGSRSLDRNQFNLRAKDVLHKYVNDSSRFAASQVEHALSSKITFPHILNKSGRVKKSVMDLKKYFAPYVRRNIISRYVRTFIRSHTLNSEELAALASSKPSPIKLYNKNSTYYNFL